MDKKEEIRKRVDRLNQASRAYYKENREILSNREYDELYDELVQLERETGIVMANSPTQNVGYELLGELPKEVHSHRMLSLDKTKNRKALAAWLGEQAGLLSWKMDGLTVVLTFEDGRLDKAVTRGNGDVGEVITGNARTFVNLPVQIPCRSRVVVRGEAYITYSDFQAINETLPEMEARYKNPRNLCSGSVRQLNPQVTAQRKVHFCAFALTESPGCSFQFRHEQMAWLSEQGFETVEEVPVTAATVGQQVDAFAARVQKNDVPSDGLVLIYDDIAYGESLGSTAKFPRDAIAFKWQDELAETRLRRVEWSPSRTGLINPVAVFDPVELEGTTVRRASVHNVSILKKLRLGIGDTLQVYKANMIIPQIAENLTGSGTVTVPAHCPVCCGVTQLQKEQEVEVLYCMNPECPAKKIKGFALFVSRDAMNIEGLSESTIEKLVRAGLIREPADFFRLHEHCDRVISIEGLGGKSFQNLMEAVERARETTPARLLYGLGISGIGTVNARMISRTCGDDWERICNLTKEELLEVKGVGTVLAEAFTGWFAVEEHRLQVQHILQEIHFRTPQKRDPTQTLDGMTVVITGRLEHFPNRRALQSAIEQRGGIVSGSVSGRTDYLINNDTTSQSAKNKKAKKERVPVISEEEFLRQFDIAGEQ